MFQHYYSLKDYMDHSEPSTVHPPINITYPINTPLNPQITTYPFYTRTDISDRGTMNTIEVIPMDGNGNRLDKVPQLMDTFMNVFGFDIKNEIKEMKNKKKVEDMKNKKKGVKTVSEPKMVKVNRHYGLNDITKTFYSLKWVEDKEDHNWVLTTVVIFKDNRKVIVKSHVKDIVCVEIVEDEEGTKKIVPTEESKEIGLAYALLKANEGALVESSTDNQIVGNGYMTKLKRIVNKAEVSMKTSEKAQAVRLVTKDTIKMITPNDVKETKVTPTKPVSKNNKKNLKQDKKHKKLISE